MGISGHAFWAAQCTQYLPADYQHHFETDIISFILAYLHDILSYSRSMGEHLDHLRCAFGQLRRAKLLGRLPKCKFLKDKVDYVGFKVSREGSRS